MALDVKYKEDIQVVSSLDLPWHNLSGCNILITGATGLIGSTLVEVLMSRVRRDFKVYACGRNRERAERLFSRYAENNNFQIICCDICEPLATTIDFHYIIHAASGAAPVEFAKHPVEVMMANFIGTQNLLEYGRNHHLKRMLYISSGEVYGEGDGREFEEDYSGYVNPMAARSCYPSSKRAAETLCASYGVEHGLDVVVARPCHVYGPNFTENDNRVYAQFIRNILRGEDIMMKSTGEQFRSWCYVVDCVSALLFILFKGHSNEAYNIADGESNIRIKELAEIVAHIGGKKVVIDIPSGEEKKGFNIVNKSIFSTKKLEGLGWKPLTGINEGLEHTINYLNTNSK